MYATAPTPREFVLAKPWKGRPDLRAWMPHNREDGTWVTPVPVQAGPQGVPMLLNGEADIIFADYVSLFQANDTGALQVKILAVGSRAAPRSLSIMALPDSPIKTPEDLEGKTINVQVLKNFQELALAQVLKRYGVDPAKITYVPVTFQDLWRVSTRRSCRAWSRFAFRRRRIPLPGRGRGLCVRQGRAATARRPGRHRPAGSVGAPAGASPLKPDGQATGGPDWWRPR
ncbi:ABC transporter substrate-binding protein [Nonomuraea sp. NPDC050540]|uniref:ABC transporter substrate-binding protein n=1 Tax=Nonomuraea sp. NPDC050540 TaxID=3364367 RepID=UPI003787B116